MRQKAFWLDLAVCSLWMLVTLANCSWWSFPAHFLMVVTVVMRIILSFFLYRREKRSWIPLIVFSALFVLLSVVGQVMVTTGDFADLPFVVLGINNDHLTHNIIKCLLLAWLFLEPLTVYIVGLYRKTMKPSTLTWEDALGAILWKDKGARLYCLLLLIAICALHAGLAMDHRMCRFACIVLSPLSLYLIARHTTSCRGVSEEYPVVGKLWLMVVAMVLFVNAQCYAGMWRIGMLATSLSMVVYACWRIFGKQGLTEIRMMAILYLGVILPTLSIGYNQYACIEYGRRGFYTLAPYQGIIYIDDANTGRLGLRDRYGMLVEPIYNNIVYSTDYRPFGAYELRKNGNYSLYSVYRNEISKVNDIDQNLQDSICAFLKDHFNRYAYDFKDRLELRVTRKFNSEIILAHVKMRGDGMCSYHNYPDRPYISEDSVTIRSGEFVADSVVFNENTFHVLHYSYDVKQDSTVLYNIDVKTAKQRMPQQDALVGLTKEIEALLKQ